MTTSRISAAIIIATGVLFCGSAFAQQSGGQGSGGGNSGRSGEVIDMRQSDASQTALARTYAQRRKAGACSGNICQPAAAAAPTHGRKPNRPARPDLNDPCPRGAVAASQAFRGAPVFYGCMAPT
jgi:hypothetical protein